MPTVPELKRRLALAPDDASARLQLAEVLFGEADYAAAAAVLERAAQPDGNARRLLVACHLRRGARGAAREVLEAAALARLDDPAVREELAELLLEDERVDDALLLLEEADELAPDPKRARRRAGLFLHLRLERRAAEVLRQAARLAPRDPELAAALRAVEELLGLDPLSAALSDPAVAGSQGRVAEARELLRCGELDKARRSLALATPGDPGYRELREAIRKAQAGSAGPRGASDSGQPGLIGVLGWSPRGGKVSPLQAVAVPGNGTLFVTGNVGETGQEAARVAWSCLKARATELALSVEVTRQDLHLHFADTEISKEGASSGLALVLAGISALRREPLPENLAATGEITLAGELKPVAGIHEKLVAATLAGVTQVLLPRRNLRDARDLPRLVPARVRLTFVDTISEAAAAARREN
ncbi:MAG TPA: S16 family serine protease [Myxococcales bacterium]|jgi:ATP-dependent Lon protease